MEDVVLDTNAYRLLLNINYVNKMLEINDEIFVSKKGWRTEIYGVPELQIGFNILYDSMKKLSKRNKFHERSGTNMLPTSLREALENNGADDVDVEVACVAYDRKGSGHGIFIVSRDYHFERAKQRFESQGINIECHNDELNRVGLLN